jgi:signal transduction histidine kinase
VEDDGVGFDMEELKKEKSVGLRNIRFRLAQLAGGTMDIVSEVGIGTTVTITMPKKEV